MKVLMPLNTLANRCGHFFNCNLEPGYEEGPNVNNGYNCDHPDCEEEQEGIGCCYSWSCPVAYSADGMDCARYGVDCEDCGKEDCDCYDNMMVCEIPEEEFDERYMYRMDGGEENEDV